MTLTRLLTNTCKTIIRPEPYLCISIKLAVEHTSADALGIIRPFKSGVRLLHHNAPAHTSQVGVAAVQTAGFQTLNHSPYCPDVAPSASMCKLEINLHGRSFDLEEEVIETVEDFVTQYLWTSITEAFVVCTLEFCGHSYALSITALAARAIACGGTGTPLMI